MRPTFIAALAAALAACAALIDPGAPVADLLPATDRSAELERIDAAMTDAMRAARIAAEQGLVPSAAAQAATTPRTRPMVPVTPTLPMR